MSFVCTDYEKLANKRKRAGKTLKQVKATHLFESISGSGAMHCKSQSFKCMGGDVEQESGRKSRGQVSVKMQNSKVPKEGACAERGGSFPSFRFHCQSIFKAGGPDSDKSNRLSSDSSDVYKLKSRTRSWGSLASGHTRLRIRYTMDTQ